MEDNNELLKQSLKDLKEGVTDLDGDPDINPSSKIERGEKEVEMLKNIHEKIAPKLKQLESAVEEENLVDKVVSEKKQ